MTWYLDASLCYAVASKNPILKTLVSQKLLVTVARRFTTRPVGPTFGRQSRRVYHYHKPKNAQYDISNPLLFRISDSFEMEHCLR